MATYRAVGTTDITTNSTAFVQFPQMLITFTPRNPVVYLHFSAGGTYSPQTNAERNVWFELRCNGTLIKEFDFQSGEVWNQWFAHFSYPVNVSVGTSTTCNVLWATDDGTYTLFNNAGSQSYSHRSLIIYDQP